jgi:6-pyruvoyltetrahydropterin/6-carboxytetrahydropterin synthase
MSLNGEGQYCNPSAENISKEVFLAIDILFASYNNLKIHSIKLWETPNCSVECIRESISEEELANFHKARFAEINAYALDKGIVEYDDRKQ